MPYVRKQTRRPRRGGALLAALLLAFVVTPLIEIALFIQVGGWIGLWPTLALIVLTAVAGTWILRLQGLGLLRRARDQLERGVPPVAEVFSGVCLIVAGALLLTPGFLTDAIGGLLLVPPVRALLYRSVRDRLEVQVERRYGPAAAAGAEGEARGEDGGVIEGEFEPVDDDDEAPPSPPPPPRGGWGPGRP